MDRRSAVLPLDPGRAHLDLDGLEVPALGGDPINPDGRLDQHHRVVNGLRSLLDQRLAGWSLRVEPPPQVGVVNDASRMDQKIALSDRPLDGVALLPRAI